MYKTIQKQIWSTRASVIVSKIPFSHFRDYLEEMGRMGFQGNLVKRSVCFDSTEEYVTKFI